MISILTAIIETSQPKCPPHLHRRQPQDTRCTTSDARGIVREICLVGNYLQPTFVHILYPISDVLSQTLPLELDASPELIRWVMANVNSTRNRLAPSLWSILEVIARSVTDTLDDEASQRGVHAPPPTAQTSQALTFGPFLSFAISESGETKDIEPTVKLMRYYPGLVNTLVHLGNQAPFFKELLELADLQHYAKQSYLPVSCLRCTRCPM